MARQEESYDMSGLRDSAARGMTKEGPKPQRVDPASVPELLQLNYRLL
jgi:hypothetical protein